MYMNKYLKFLLIFLVVFLAYGQTLGMYFWVDDNALMFKLQHLAGGAGLFGAGVFGQGSYRYIVVPFVPLYPIFKLNPMPYFAVGILIYFFAAVAVYFLAYTLSHDKKVALIASLIFSSGYIGSDVMWRLLNSYQTGFMIVLLCITLILYKRFIDTKSYIFYFLSLVFFVVTMELAFIRSHGIIFLILGLEFILNYQGVFGIVKSVFRVIPFLYFHYRWYIADNPSSHAFSNLFQEIFIKGKFDLLLNPFITLENLFIPDNFHFPLLLFLIILVFILLFKRNKLLWFAIIFIMGNYLTYYLLYSSSPSGTTQRYLTPSFVGLAIFWAVLFRSLFQNSKAYALFSLAIIVFYLVNVNLYEADIIKTRSVPTRIFYQTLRKDIPKVPKGAAIFFDTRDDGVSKNEIANFFGVGSMPNQTAIAIYYGIDRYDLYMPETFNELLLELRDGLTTPDKIYTFYYSSKGGLIDTTKNTRKILFGKNSTVDVTNPDKINYMFSSPIKVNFNLSYSIDMNKITYKTSHINLENYLKYLVSQDQYYQTVSATSSSEWKYQEIRYITDKDPSTTWMGNRLYWNDNHKEAVFLDLGKMEEVGAIKLTLGAKVREPAKHAYACSQDTISWSDLGIFSIPPAFDSQIVIDKVSPKLCRYIKLMITETPNEDAPQLAEIEVIDNAFRDNNFQLADDIKNDPYAFLRSANDRDLVDSYIKQIGLNSQICWHTDGQSNIDNPSCSNLSIKDNNPTDYSVVIPPSGTRLKKVYLSGIPEAVYQMRNISIIPLSYKDIKDGGMIIDYSKN